MAEHDLVGGVGDRLVRGRARAAHAPGLHGFREHRHKRNLPCNVGCDHRWNHGAEHQQVDATDVELCAVYEFGHRQLAELDRRQTAKRTAGLRKGRAHAGDDRHAAAGHVKWHDHES